jgi:uncharacterized damage-inducible protein DinB
MLTVRKLRELYAYDEWATNHLLDAMAGLTPEQLAREFAGPTTSLLERTRHLLFTLRGWWGALNGEARGSYERPELLSVDDLKKYHGTVRDYVAAGLDRLTDAMLQEPLPMPDGSTGPAWGEGLRHVVNHGTYHRGQVATLLTLHGVDFSNTDYIFWLMETK